MPMLTYQRYQMAFTSPEDRDAFFERAHRGVKVGTAMTHVLGTNIGVWGDEYELKRDAAGIMKYELDTWADSQGEKKLGIPVEGIINSRMFSEAFKACRVPNRDEIDRLVRSGGREESPTADLSSLASYLGINFVEELYRSLCELADKYHNANRYHDEVLARIGMR